ncbi:MAG: hypothetical protein KAI17_05095 [Thiotrichaceae bacterium]|nr:hypothetical protein [Thiotrichaceae bacterium]
MFSASFLVFTLLLQALLPGNVLAHTPLFHCDINDKKIDLSAWHHKYDDRCFFLGRNNPKNENTHTINTILVEMRKEPEWAAYLLEKAHKQGTAFCIEDRADGCRGYFDYGYNIIAVREKLDLFTKVIIFIHELRHVDQLSRGFERSLDYDANEMARMTIAIEADANAVLALYTWRLKQKGYPEAWDKLFELSRYSDIYKSFKAEILSSGDELKASRAAFIQWYKSDWRTTSYSRNSIGGYFDMLDDTNLIQRYDKLPEDYFNDLCILPDGRNYGCHLTDEIKYLGK